MQICLIISLACLITFADTDIPHLSGIHNQAKALHDHCVVCPSHLSCTSVFIQIAQQTSTEKMDLPLIPELPKSVKSLNKAT